MNLEYRPLHPLFAAEACGLDISRPLDAAAVAQIVAGMDHYAVLLFRGQALDQDQQMAFTRQFGQPYLGFGKIAGRGATHRFKYDELADMSNLDAQGRIADRNSRKMYSQLANQLWHSDSSFQDPPARYSMLHSVVNPPWGGETEFADMRAAYDALPDNLKSSIRELRAEHFALHSRAILGYATFTEEDRNLLPPVEWPIVRIHPGSGRKLLFVGVHTTRVTGMQLAEGRLLLAELLEHATQREFVYRHHWEVGDLIMWDNRCTLHRGRRYDLDQARELRRSTTGDVPLAFEGAEHAADKSVART